MPKATAPLETSTPSRFQQPGPDHGELGRQGVGVDDGRDRVGGVVEAVDEFEAERDQERDAEQEERHDRRRTAAEVGDVGADRIGHVEQPAGEHGENAEHEPDIHRMIEMRFSRHGGRSCPGGRQIGGGHRRLLPEARDGEAYREAV